MLNYKKRIGFTLIELLAVIATIALVSAILLPVLASARKKARQSVCLSNLRQIGMAVRLYATDFDDHIPYAISPDTKWRSTVGLAMFGNYTQDVCASDGLCNGNDLAHVPGIQEVLKMYGVVGSLWECPQDQMQSYFRESDPTFYKETWFEQDGSSYAYDDVSALLGTGESTRLSADSVPIVWDLAFMDADQRLLTVSFADGHAKLIASDDFASLLTGVRK